MRTVPGLCGLLAGLMWLVGTNAVQARVQLDTSVAPPYQTEEAGVLGGTAVTTLDCVFSRVGLPYEARVVPWRRAWFNLQNGLTDGVFSVMPHAEMETVADLSGPLALEKWYWYARSAERLRAPGFPESARLGVVLGSNVSGWLRTRGLAPVEEVTSERQLLQLLDNDRIDAFLADSRTVEALLERHAAGVALFSRFERYMPLAAYFSHRFLTSRPGFLARFNGALADCNTESMQLSAGEQLRLTRLLESNLAPLVRSREVLGALRQRRETQPLLPETRIMALDQQWRAEIGVTPQPLIQAVLAEPLSRFLAAFESHHQDLYNELLVVDRQGLNVGISRVSSDYWQGDEEKFSRVFPPATSDHHMGAIEYDASTGRFQVHISVRVVDPDTGTALGVLIAGVDVEALLQE